MAYNFLLLSYLGTVEQKDELVMACLHLASDTGMENALDVLVDSDALSALERCELLTLLKRENQRNVNSRLIAMLMSFPDEIKESCRIILTAASEDVDSLFTRKETIEK